MDKPSISLATWLMLACVASSASATKRPFNIHDDLLAYPQYQVVFPQEYILDAQAEELLRAQASSEDKSHVQNNPQVYMGKNDANDADHDIREKNAPTYIYEEMVLDDRRLLCQIPRVNKDELNTTAWKQAGEADEKKELARATDRGLELLREMEGKCMYYFSGWWSYSFCYRQQIKQFHALPAGRGIPHYPPVEDPTTHSFILGQFPADSDDARKRTEEPKQTTKTDMAELHSKGGSRYLVQHLRGGTKCDLTGRERRVEVQFHCHPQSTDQIGLIKELTTCSYLMVIYTPRLCDDVAFLPTQEDEVHDIECREILFPEDVPDWEAVKEWYMAHQLPDAAAAAAAHEKVQTVGGIEVGGRKLVGMEGKRIDKGRVASMGEEHVEVVAKRENGEVRRTSRQVLKKYDLDPDRVEDVKKRLEELAGDKDWTLEVVESNGVIKFQGVVDAEDEDESTTESEANTDSSPQRQQQSKGDAAADEGDTVSRESTKSGPESRDGSESEQPLSSDRKPDGPEGSEETFKDEL
ncbi:uncharacterized protein N7459_002157 [Penicillium hispanicum]|uniref:uncharacterized protein n=1 Tax=Penicillium hispanicum TaxID=1080232 RepID=UPI00254186A5|nr:uncharacterized protein N7459_002157 [Penicillium hispanicum]KAJ5591788.1 hypothetical protein N7459_002157 [Penicillium hispanicum]